MFSHWVRTLVTAVYQNGAKSFSTTPKTNFKVAVVGAAGGIGQPLGLLLKMHPLVTELSLYDPAPVTRGVAVELAHVNTCARVTGHRGPEELCCAVYGADIVIVAAGVPRKPGMSRDDLFDTNASIVRDVTSAVAENASTAILAILTNPVNSVVPIACEVMKKAGVFDPARVLGVTTLDVIRTSTFIGEVNGIEPQSVKVPVIGGHAGATIIPVLSQSEPAVALCEQRDIENLTKKIQEAGTEVVKAKAGGGSATLSTAYATARFTDSLLKGLKGEKNIVECAYVQSDVTESPYFSTPLVLGEKGVEKNLGLGTLNVYEINQLEKAIPELIKNVKTGEEWSKQKIGGTC